MFSLFLLFSQSNTFMFMMRSVLFFCMRCDVEMLVISTGATRCLHLRRLGRWAAENSPEFQCGNRQERSITVYQKISNHPILPLPSFSPACSLQDSWHDAIGLSPETSAPSLASSSSEVWSQIVLQDLQGPSPQLRAPSDNANAGYSGQPEANREGSWARG